MIVISGATRPEAQAAAVMSEVILHGKFLALYFEPYKGRIEVDLEGAFERMTFGVCSKVFLLTAGSRPLPLRFRVMTCKVSWYGDTLHHSCFGNYKTRWRQNSNE